VEQVSYRVDNSLMAWEDICTGFTDVLSGSCSPLRWGSGPKEGIFVCRRITNRLSARRMRKKHAEERNVVQDKVSFTSCPLTNLCNVACFREPEKGRQAPCRVDGCGKSGWASQDQVRDPEWRFPGGWF